MKLWQNLLAQQMAQGWANALAVRYNGTTQYSYCAAPTDVQALSTFSMVVWFTLANYTQFGTVAYIAGTTGEFIVSQGYPGTNWALRVLVTPGFVINNYGIAGGALSPANCVGSRHCLVVSYDHSNTTVVYSIDGTVLFTSAAYDLRPLRVTPTIMQFGDGWAKAGGVFDEMSIWSAVKTYADVSDGGAPKNLTGAPGLLHTWRCGDTPGDTGDAIQDAVPGGPNLTGVGSPTLVAV